MNRLGIIDWGIGGVSIYRLIKAQADNVPVSYFSDTGVTPYGRMSRRELITRLQAAVGFLKTRRVTHLVIGCNAASTVLEHLDNSDIKIEGVIEPAVEMTVRIKPMRLALIGGRRTVLSGTYAKAFRSRGIAVTQRIAQPLSALIERGDLSSDQFRDEARQILSPIRDHSHILLACTHYPAALPLLGALVSPSTIFIDPAGELVRRVKKWGLVGGPGADEFFTSGDADQMKISAQRAFSVDIAAVTRISSLDRLTTD